MLSLSPFPTLFILIIAAEGLPALQPGCFAGLVRGVLFLKYRGYLLSLPPMSRQQFELW